MQLKLIAPWLCLKSGVAFWRLVALLAAMCCAEPTATATETAPLHVVFVNGIQNTPEEALVSMLRLRDELTNTGTRGEGLRRPFIVAEHVYNSTGWGGVENSVLGAIQDGIELYLLKTAEECFRADFNSIVVPHDDPTRTVDLAAANRVKAFLDNMLPGSDERVPCGNNGLVALGLVSHETMESARQAALAIVERVKRFDATIVVAHSHGNLLAHLAYAALVAELGDATSQRLRIVNVANTAEVSANSLVVTHEADVALAALKTLPGALALLPAGLGAWRSTPSCEVPALCPFRLGSPSLGAASDYGDLPRHSFVDTYLSDFHVEVADARGVSFTTGKTAFVDRLVDVIYAASESLRPRPPNGAPMIGAGSHPLATTANAGTIATFTVVATGSTTPLTYQWRRNGVAVPCSSPTDCSRLDWVVSPADDGARFDVVVSNVAGSATSLAATLTLIDARAPDLAVASVNFGPASVLPMGAVDITLSVLNQGTAAANASTAVIRINRSSTSSADPLASLNVPVPALIAGASAALPVTSITAPATPGTYRVWVVLDNQKTSGQPAAAEANDIVLAVGTLIVMAPVNGGPDLVIQSLSHRLTSATVPPGGKLPVFFTVTNTGAESAAASKAVVRINSSSTSPSGADLVAVDVPALAAGASVARSATVRVPIATGAYRLWAVADSAATAGQVGTAAGNDAALATQALTVADGAAAAADLVPTTLSFGPPRVTQGGLVVVDFAIRNQGLLASRTSLAAVRLNPVGAGPGGIERASVLVPELPPGLSRSFTVAFPASVDAGSYQIWVEADSTGGAGQSTAAAFANDPALAPGELSVMARVSPPGATAEGAYAGSITGSTATAFRLLILENGEFWALYGVPSGGRFAVLGFMQGVGTSAGGSFSSSDLRDFGFAPSARGTVAATYAAANGTVTGLVTTSRGSTTLTGGPLTDVAYEYNQTARLTDVQGTWGLSTNTGDSMVADIRADGTFDTTTNAGCRLSGTFTPRASGKNVFDAVVSFGAAPCALPGQTARGVALANVERDGRRQLTIGVVDASRSLGLTASGYR